MSKASKDYHSSVVWDGGALVLSREVAEEYPEQSCSFIYLFIFYTCRTMLAGTVVISLLSPFLI